MSSYDVFIKGISPGRNIDAEKIKNKASAFLKIEEHKLEALWSTPDGLCIRHGVDEQEAVRIQDTLSKFGLICVYRAVKVIHDAPVELEKPKPNHKPKPKHSNIYTCPNCEHGIPRAEYNSVPEKCPDCGIYIEKFLAIQKHEQEMEQAALEHVHESETESESESAIRLRELLQKQYEEDRDELRKRELDAAVLMVAKRNARNRIIYAGILSVVFSVVLGYFFMGEDLPIIGKYLKNSKNIVVVTGKKVFKSPVKNSKVDSLKNELETDKNQNKSSSIISVSPLKAEPVQQDIILIAKIRSFLQASNNSQEWDLYLSKTVSKLDGTDSMTKAVDLSSNIIDTRLYIETMAKLLSTAQQKNQTTLSAEIISSMETRVNLLPVTEQPGFLAQAGFYQNQITKKSSLFNRAESIFAQLPDTISKIKSASKLAIYFYKVGNIEASNTYFKLMITLLSGIQSPDQQVEARIAIAIAYKGVGDGVNADSWLAGTGEFLPQTSTETIKLMVEAYALLNQSPAPVLQYVAMDKQSEYLFDAIKEAAMYNFIDNAININKTVSDPAYQALAFEFIASFDEKNPGFALALAGKLVDGIKSPIEAAVVASRLAAHYTRNGQTTKAIEFIKISKEHLALIPESELKDNVRSIMAINYARVFRFEHAENLVVDIQSYTIKTATKNDISKIRSIYIKIEEPVK
jgi:hypothetical protein